MLKTVHQIIGFNPKTNSYETHIDIPTEKVSRVRSTIGLSGTYMPTPVCTHIYPSLLAKVSLALGLPLTKDFSWFYGLSKV